MKKYSLPIITLLAMNLGAYAADAPSADEGGKPSRIVHLYKPGSATTTDINLDSPDWKKELADLEPGKDRPIVNTTSTLTPAKAYIQHMLGGTSFDPENSGAQNVMLTIAFASRLMETGTTENRNIKVDFSGIHLGNSTPEMNGPRGHSPHDLISWDDLNDLISKIEGKEVVWFDASTMKKKGEEAAAKATPPSSHSASSDDDEAEPVSAAFSFDLAIPSGGATKINFANPHVDNVLANLEPNKTRHMLGNAYGLTPARRFIAKYKSETAIDMSLKLGAIKDDKDFTGFLVAVAAYLRHAKTPDQDFENLNVIKGSEDGKATYFGYKAGTSDEDENSVVVLPDMLSVYEKIKEASKM